MAWNDLLTKAIDIGAAGYAGGKESFRPMYQYMKESQNQAGQQDLNTLLTLYKTTTDPEARKVISNKILNLPQIKKFGLSMQNLGQGQPQIPSGMIPESAILSPEGETTTRYGLPMTPEERRLQAAKVTGAEAETGLIQRMLGQQPIAQQPTPTVFSRLQDYDYGTAKLGAGLGPISDGYATELGLQRPTPRPIIPTTTVGMPSEQPIMPELEGYNVGMRAGPFTLTPKEQRIIPAETLTGIDALKTIQQLTTDIEKLYKDEYVGPAQGYIRGAVRRVTGIGKDEEEFRRNTNMVGQLLAYALSGKQISAQEMQMLKDNAPNVNLPPKTFKSNLAAFKKLIDTIMMQRQQGLTEAGYKMSKPTEKTPISIPKVKTIDEAKALSPGTHFIDPNGVERIR